MWYGNVIPDGMGMSYLCGMGMSYQMEWESHTIGMESYQRWNHTIPFIQYHTNTISYHGMAIPFIPYHTNIYHTIYTIPYQYNTIPFIPYHSYHIIAITIPYTEITIP